MTAQEFMLWAAYDRVQPIGDERADASVAQLTALMANINRDTKKKPDPFTISDFLLFKPPSMESEDVLLSRKARAALLNTGR